MNYNYLIVGSGLYGATIAQQAKKAGKSVLVIDKRPNVGGNIYTEKVEGINVHKYGAHIFHTNNKEVWDYVTSFVDFNRFTNSPVANYKGELYSMPFNMYTFNKMWGVVTPEEAAAKIEEQKKEITGEPKNLEEQAISLVGRESILRNGNLETNPTTPSTTLKTAHCMSSTKPLQKQKTMSFSVAASANTNTTTWIKP